MGREWDHHRICSGSAFIKQEYGPPEWFVNMFLQVILAPMSFKKACFYRKNALQCEALNQVYSVVIAN